MRVELSVDRFFWVPYQYVRISALLNIGISSDFSFLGVRVIVNPPTTDENQPTRPQNSKENFDEMSFADMLDQYNFDMPYRGQILEGIILEAGHDEVLVDVGLKRDAIVPRKDLSLLDDKLLEKIVPGAEVLTYVLQPRNNDGELIVSINKALELEDWQRVNEMMEKDAVVDAEVIDMNRGGVLVRYGRLVGFVPQSHIVSMPRFASQDELFDAKRHMVGNKLSLKFIEIDRKRNRLIMSERLAQADLQQSRMSELEVGQKVTGRVVSIVAFGAFVDLGGVDGLIHISKLAHSHVNHPGEVLSVGDEVEVLIDDIDAEKQRISLDRAALIPDPWATVEENLAIGSLVEGTVTNVVDFGVFVQLPNSLQGLVHISEMTMFGTQNPRDVLRDGEHVLVRVISIEAERQRIGLSIDKVTVDEQEEWLHNRREGGENVGGAAVIENMIDNTPDSTPAATEAEEDFVPAASDVEAEAETETEAEA